MGLINMHKVLIVASIVLSAVYSVWSCARFMRSANPDNALGMAVSAVVVGGLVVYLRRFRQRYTRPHGNSSNGRPPAA